VVLHTRFDELPAALLLGARHILCYTAGAAKLSRQSCKEVSSELQSCFIGATNLSCRSCKRSCKVVSPELHAAKVGAAKVSRRSCKAIRSKLQRCLAGATKVSCRSCKRRTPPRAVMVLQARRRAFLRCCKPSVVNAAAVGERFVAEASCSSGGSGPTCKQRRLCSSVRCDLAQQWQRRFCSGGLARGRGVRPERGVCLGPFARMHGKNRSSGKKGELILKHVSGCQHRDPGCEVSAPGGRPALLSVVNWVASVAGEIATRKDTSKLLTL
jgi:hypothetical protein